MKRILLFVLTGLVLLTGCTTTNKTGVNDLSQEKASESQDAGTDKENRILPEGDILYLTREIAGESMKFSDEERAAITTLVEEIEKANVIKEEDAVNPDSHLLGFDFSIVMLASDGKEMLVHLAPFDDGRVHITIEEEERDRTIWVKSSKLVDQMKLLDTELIDNMIGAVIVDSDGNQYSLSKEDVSEMQTILNNIQETAGDYKCPFDVDMIFHTKEKDIEAKYCHDSCGILVIQGGYYRLNEQDAEWLSELVDRVVN